MHSNLIIDPLAPKKWSYTLKDLQQNESNKLRALDQENFSRQDIKSITELNYFFEITS